MESFLFGYLRGGLFLTPRHETLLLRFLLLILRLLFSLRLSSCPLLTSIFPTDCLSLSSGFSFSVLPLFFLCGDITSAISREPVSFSRGGESHLFSLCFLSLSQFFRYPLHSLSGYLSLVFYLLSSFSSEQFCSEQQVCCPSRSVISLSSLLSVRLVLASGNNNHSTTENSNQKSSE